MKNTAEQIAADLQQPEGRPGESETATRILDAALALYLEFGLRRTTNHVRHVRLVAWCIQKCVPALARLKVRTTNFDSLALVSLLLRRVKCPRQVPRIATNFLGIALILFERTFVYHTRQVQQVSTHCRLAGINVTDKHQVQMRLDFLVTEQVAKCLFIRSQLGILQHLFSINRCLFCNLLFHFGLLLSSLALDFASRSIRGGSRRGGRGVCCTCIFDDRSLFLFRLRLLLGFLFRLLAATNRHTHSLFHTSRLARSHSCSFRREWRSS